ncbi:hypothetical protein OGX96_19025 [Citrobacter sp. Cpo100]|uniref:hypothetical protein n=1 Tax=Citrobacter sp. Cpo100 TaxID=2985141 RepID=UPI002577F00B|nr:hypothetical protein [Citrobacter sp. Cpo100]MDM2823165.1 hypothetical protein [Citrobacter sp. Cpo100]
MFAISGKAYGIAPTAAGSPSFILNIADTHSNSKTVTIPVSVVAAVSYAHVSDGTVTGSADGTWNGSNKHGVAQHRLFHCVASADDGSFTYLWGWTGTAPTGLSYDTPTTPDTYVSGTQPTAGTFHGVCTVTDTYGGTGQYTWTDTVS